MPTVIIEGPRISLTRKRSLVRKLTAVVASAYDWPLDNIVVILRENPDENVARGGRLLIDGGRPRRSPQAQRSYTDENKMSPPDPGRPPANRWLIAIAVMSSAIMEVLDTSVVNVSLPHIAGSLSATVDEATWVLTSYLIANAVILPISGWLANLIGRKRLLLTVVSGFTLSSVLCGLAPSLGALIFFRVLQGTTGGGLQPLSQAVLLEEFPPEERGKAMAFWSLGIVAAPILGPTLGGWITDTYSWRWVFYINLPIGIFSLVMISLFLYDPPYIRRGSLRVDLWGLGMLAVGMAALQIMLDKGQEEDWFASHFIVTLAVIAAVMLTAFVIRELYTPQPIVRFRLLRYRNFAAGIVIGHGTRIRAVRQPGPAAALHADAARVDGRNGRHLDQPARDRHRRCACRSWVIFWAGAGTLAGCWSSGLSSPAWPSSATPT